jgi:uncharacterized membrane protein YdbT with pleckstrin-like domain
VVATPALPEQLLDGGELIVFAIKPSLWFIVLASAKWLAAALVIWVAARAALSSTLALPLMQLAAAVAIARMAWATMQWSTRLYVLTNRRVMRIRGVFNVQVFECPLSRIENTELLLSLGERLVRAGTIYFSTASGDSSVWRTVARPLEVHERLREAIRRARNRGDHAL